MNKRIRELAEQAGITTNLDTDYYERDMNKWVDYYSEKFAELIVFECSKVIVFGGYMNHAVGEKTQLTPVEIATMIKEHFGVEE